MLKQNKKTRNGDRNRRYKLDNMKSNIKAVQRQTAVEYRGKVYKHPVLFPWIKFLDVDLGLREGSWSKTKSCPIVIEKEHDYHNVIEKGMKKRFKNFAGLHRGEFATVDFGKHLSDKEKIDYLFLDLCGNYGARESFSMYTNRPHYDDNMRLPVTLQAVNRRKESQNCIGSVPLPGVRKMLNNAVNEGFLGCSKDIYNNLCAQLNILYLSLPDRELIINKIVLYKNSDKNFMAMDMVFIDITCKKISLDKKRQNKFFAFIRRYSKVVHGISKINIDGKNTRRKYTKRTTIQKPNFFNLLNMQKRSEITKKGNKIRIAVLARKYNTTTGNIVAGLNRAFTCRGL